VKIKKWGLIGSSVLGAVNGLPITKMVLKKYQYEEGFGKM
jgi:hypothetical protein